MLNEEKSASGGDDQKDLPLPETQLPKPEKDLPLPRPQTPASLQTKQSDDEQTDKEVPSSTSAENVNSQSQKKSKINARFIIILLMVFLLILILGAVGYLFLGKSTNSNTDLTPTPEQVVCAQEALLCPDEVTYVSREGPNCEFAQCPEVPETNPEKNSELSPAPTTPTSTSSSSLQ